MYQVVCRRRCHTTIVKFALHCHIYYIARMDLPQQSNKLYSYSLLESRRTTKLLISWRLVYKMSQQSLIVTQRHYNLHYLDQQTTIVLFLTDSLLQQNSLVQELCLMLLSIDAGRHQQQFFRKETFYWRQIAILQYSLYYSRENELQQRLLLYLTQSELQRLGILERHYSFITYIDSKSWECLY